MKEIIPIMELDAEVSAPPAKAYTLRALFIAALAKGQSVLYYPLIAEDQEYAIAALRDLGVEIKEEADRLVIEGCDGRFSPVDKPLFIGNSGVTARVLAVLASFAPGEVIIDGTERMRTGRPIKDLLDAIEPLGIRSESSSGCPPIKISGELLGGKTRLKGKKSSQYFSAILLSGPYAKEAVEIETLGELYSKPYLDITIDIMRKFGATITDDDYRRFRLEPTGYKGIEYKIEGDYSNAAYFFAAAAVTEGRVKVKNLNPQSAQGDRRFVDFLEMMGCSVQKGDDYIQVKGDRLKGVTLDMQDYPDIVQPLAVVAAFAEGESTFHNISHLKYKECDRIEAPAAELRKMGIEVRTTDDSLTVVGGKPHGAEIDTYKDHRMAMSFAVAGLAVDGIFIKDPENVNKSFPGFFEALEGMR